MADPAFNIAAIVLIAALALFAVRINRQDRHPIASGVLWMCAIVVLFWAGLVWLMRP
jgi:hypothetical protein